MIFTVMENQQSVLFALNDFKKEVPPEIPTILEQYLEFISKSGQTLFEWSYLKPLFVYKLNKVACEFYLDHPTDQYPPRPNSDNPSYNDLKQRILKQIDKFQGTPFTIQRLCELILSPLKYYKRPDKFLRGVERACMVVSTIDPYGNKIHCEDSRFSGNVGCLPINGSDNELWTFPNIHTANSNSPPLENDNETLEASGRNSDSNQTVRPSCLISNGSSTETSTTLPWMGSSELKVAQNDTSAADCAAEEEEDCDDSSTDNEDGDHNDESNKSKSPTQQYREQILAESNNPHQCSPNSSSPSNASNEQLTVTVTLSAESAGKLNDVPSTKSPSSSPTNTSDLRPIGQLEAFVQNVSESGGFVERLNRSVSPGRCNFAVSGDRQISDEEEDIAASPAKKRRLSPQSYSPPKLLNSPQSSLSTKEILIDSSEPMSSSSIPFPDNISKSTDELFATEKSPMLPTEDSQSNAVSILTENESVDKISEEAMLDVPIHEELNPVGSDSTDLSPSDSKPSNSSNNDNDELLEHISEENIDSADASVNDVSNEQSLTIRDEESGEVDTSGIPSNQSRGQSSNIDLETGEQE